VAERALRGLRASLPPRRALARTDELPLTPAGAADEDGVPAPDAR
jgi:hypothetical protein